MKSRKQHAGINAVIVNSCLSQVGFGPPSLSGDPLREARRLLKAGAPQVPTKCKAMANNARFSSWGYYIGCGINDPNAAMEELLASFNMRPLFGAAPRPGGNDPAQ